MLVVLALRPSSKVPAVVAPVAPEKAAVVAPPPAPAPVVDEKSRGAPAPPPPETKSASRPPEAGARASARGKAHRSSGELVRDIASKAGVDREPASPPSERAPSTPAELKNPFGNP
jgi:hypothetical protein